MRDQGEVWGRELVGHDKQAPQARGEISIGRNNSSQFCPPVHQIISHVKYQITYQEQEGEREGAGKGGGREGGGNARLVVICPLRRSANRATARTNSGGKPRI